MRARMSLSNVAMLTFLFMGVVVDLDNLLDLDLEDGTHEDIFLC